MAGRVDGDAGGAVEKDVAVDVLDGGALAARHHERIVARVGRRDDLAVALDEALAFGPGSGVLSCGASIVSPAVTFASSACPAGRPRAGRPRAASSSRMRSASAKSRRRRASCALGHAPLDLGLGHRRPLVLARAQRQHAEHVVEVVEGVAAPPATSAAPSSPASIAAFIARTSSNIAPSAAAVFRSSRIAASNSSRPCATRAASSAIGGPPAPSRHHRRAGRGSRSAGAAPPRPAPARPR